MTLQVFETDGSLADAAYVAALVRDLTEYEAATRRDTWAEDIEAAVVAGTYGPCADCHEVGDLSCGLCRSCWQGQRK